MVNFDLNSNLMSNLDLFAASVAKPYIRSGKTVTILSWARFTSVSLAKKNTLHQMKVVIENETNCKKLDNLKNSRIFTQCRQMCGTALQADQQIIPVMKSISFNELGSIKMPKKRLYYKFFFGD